MNDSGCSESGNNDCLTNQQVNDWIITEVKAEDPPGALELKVEVSHTKVMEASKKRAAIQDTLFYKVEIEAMFPGGDAGWAHYIKKTIDKNLDELIKTRASGVCKIRFIVAKDGSVSDVEALTMKGTKLAEVAINAIRKGPNWIPAKQHGRFVNAFREQPVTFTIQDQ